MRARIEAERPDRLQDGCLIVSGNLVECLLKGAFNAFTGEDDLVGHLPAHLPKQSLGGNRFPLCIFGTTSRDFLDQLLVF